MDAIFRSAHWIKGAAGTCGISVVREATQLMESLLDQARR
ncbi:Hpt domain-containing protein, partial [Escherichia coli]